MKRMIAPIRRGLMFLCIISSTQALARYSFESGFFTAAGLEDTNTDLSLFNRGATFLPGNYTLAVYVNESYITQRNITFKINEADGELSPCFSEEDLSALGIVLPYESISGCITPQQKDRFFWHVDMSSMRLKLTLPQIYTRYSDIFITPWQSWSDGLTAALFNYNYNYSQNDSQKGMDTNQYLGLEGGLNLHGFRLRNSSVWSKSHGQQSQFDSLRTYVQKDFHYLQGGEITAGQAWSDGSLFESVPFKGVMLSSVDSMLKNEYRNFVPAVRGVVNTQSATVSVKKNGRVIYQTSLPSGPFALEGIMTNGGGDYLIDVKESDGSSRQYVQSSDSLPELQSAGRLKYTLASGRSDLSSANNAYFNQFSLFYGLSEGLTVYGGSTLANDYQAYSLGLGKMVEGLGAFSADVTASKAELLNHEPDSGQSLRASYYKDFDATATSFGLFAYRYSSRGYLSFDDFLQYNHQEYSGQNKKNRFQISMTQGLDTFGSLSLNASRETYWSKTDNADSYRINHNISYNRYSLNTYFEKSKTIENKSDSVIGLAFSLSLYEEGRGGALSERLIRDNGNLSSQTSLNLSPLSDNRLGVSINGSKAEKEQEMFGISSTYSGKLAELSTGYYKSASSRRINAGIMGGGIVHQGGATLGRRIAMDSPVALINTNGAAEIKVTNGENISTDPFGYAIVSNLIAYQHNQLSIDTLSLGPGMDSTETDKLVVPKKGAVVPINFKVNRGNRALFQVYHKSKPIPLGAVASNTHSDGSVDTVFFADRGQVYFSGIQNSGEIKVMWGKNQDASCRFNFDFSANPAAVMNNKTVECQ
ncbi:MAG TPA: fimbria/pilus outer membrane usher protein [Scandinavium sp.]|jgi:outer membrane usher protein